MQAGFPTALASLLRCPDDGGPLSISTPGGASPPAFLPEGALSCSTCGRRLSLSGGVLRLLHTKQLDGESASELQVREQSFHIPELRPIDEMQMQPTLAALRPLGGTVLFEMGCGTGRYTTLLAQACRAVVAVDFSLNRLAALAQQLAPQAPVALVQAEVTSLRVAPQMFQRVLSTLTQNLPGREHRLAMFRVAADALDASGRFVFSTHFCGIRDRLLGVPQAGRYDEQEGDAGVFRYHMTHREVAREAAPYFSRVRSRPIQILLPFAAWLRLPLVALSRLAEYVPLLNQWGTLLLCVASRPIHPPVEGLAPQPNRLLRALVRWYQHSS